MIDDQEKQWEDFFAGMFIPDPPAKQKTTPPAKDPLNKKNPEPVEAKQWKNLYFRKDGAHGFGAALMDSEEQARAVADGTIEEVMLLSPTGVIFLVEGKLRINHENFSHHIQVPWRLNE